MESYLPVGEACRSQTSFGVGMRSILESVGRRALEIFSILAFIVFFTLDEIVARRTEVKNYGGRNKKIKEMHTKKDRNGD